MMPTMLCPGCGDEFVPVDELWWAVRGRYYCGEECARTAQQMLRQRGRMRRGW